MQSSILSILSINPSILSIYLSIQHFSYPRYDRTYSTGHCSEVVQTVNGVARLVEALADRIAGHQEHGALHLDKWMDGYEFTNRWVRASGHQSMGTGIGVPIDGYGHRCTNLFQAAVEHQRVHDQLRLFSGQLDLRNGCIAEHNRADECRLEMM